MSYQAKDNAYGLLASGITSGVLSLTLQSGQGDRFPVIVDPDFTLITLENAAGDREIVKVTARAAASDVLTIVRAQDGTTARAWNAGDVVELRMVASLVETAMAHPAMTSSAHLASAIAVTPVGTMASSNVQAALEELDTEKAPAFTTLGFSKGGTNATTRAAAVASLGLEAAEITVTTATLATTNIGASAGTNILLTTTATTITGFATAAAGVSRKIRASTGGITLVHSASFVLPGAANIVTAAGDCFEAYSTGSGWIVRDYQLAASLGGGKFIDKTTLTDNWEWWASGGIARLKSTLSGVPVDRITVSSAGDLGVTGAITATGNVTAYSDERVKTNWRGLPTGFLESLANVKSGIYDRTDLEQTQVGVSAQSLREVMPNAVIEDTEGKLSVAYGNAALVACIELAQQVLQLETRLSQFIGEGK